ncbi:agmatine deiminase family protein [Pontibacter cellulosilyticus]|uniref:Agmatine deiminase family protein n=1 Tax=Pontibacter cellulosilyticus TaxID=1720253 RepID=A0A923N554_9BACT|nr:agmatine deiminase family protein [Pontibacter cellulosilyticus]MBC5992421.1 agmatine deiminase family protein [Pontibacter cellulosilyticus]
MGKETNRVYFSKKLYSDERFTNTCNALTKLLDKQGIRHGLLKATKDIWCRDYMPVQTEKGKFVQFRYKPSYLTDDLELQSDPGVVCEANNLEPEFSKINLDGGNVVNWSDRAIITDRVFDENPKYTSKTKLITEIENLLKVEVIVIPQIRSDMTGHADGLVRFVDRSKVLGNNREQEYKYWKNGITKILKEHGIEYIDVPFFEFYNRKFKDNAIGCYINFLEVMDLIVLPVFEVSGNRDDEAVNLFKEIYPDRVIETINFNEIGLLGGLLNCTTWTILE